jgi:hypothetical protein
MRKFMLASLMLAIGLALGACAERTPTRPVVAQPAPTTAPTSTAKASQPTPMPTATLIPQLTKPSASNETAPFALDAIRKYLAEQLNLSVEQVKLISWQPVTWRDSCLGVHLPKQGCLDMITPGFTFKFQTSATTSVVNTDATGKNYVLAPKAESPAPLPALSWTRTGGFAGVCQNLSIYSTGVYWLTDCSTGEVLAQGMVPETDLTYLVGLFEQYGSFEWKAMPPAGSADMFNDQIQFYGIGSQALTEAEQQKLNAYLATLAGGLAK